MSTATKVSAIEKQLDDMAENEFWCTDRSRACTAAPRQALTERLDILERSLDDLTTGLMDTPKEDGHWCPTCKKEPSGWAEANGKKICGECGKTYLVHRMSQADDIKVSQADKQEQKDIEQFNDFLDKVIDPPEAEQMPKCLDCGAEMDFLPKAQAYDCFQCGFQISLAAYNRLVEDRQIAERARSELVDAQSRLRANSEAGYDWDGSAVIMLQYIVKGGE